MEALKARHKTRIKATGFMSPPFQGVCSCGEEGPEESNLLNADGWTRRHLEDVGIITVPDDRPGLKIRKHRPRPEDVPTNRPGGADRPGSTFGPMRRGRR